MLYLLTQILYSILFRYSHKKMVFIFSCFICAVFYHYLLGCNVVFIYSKIYFLLRYNRFCNFQSKFQACRSVTFRPTLFPYAIPDMACSLSQSLCKIVPYAEFSNELIAVPQVIIGFSNSIEIPPRIKNTQPLRQPLFSDQYVKMCGIILFPIVFIIGFHM